MKDAGTYFWRTNFGEGNRALHRRQLVFHRKEEETVRRLVNQLHTEQGIQHQVQDSEKHIEQLGTQYLQLMDQADQAAKDRDQSTASQKQSEADQIIDQIIALRRKLKSDQHKLSRSERTVMALLRTSGKIRSRSNQLQIHARHKSKNLTVNVRE